MIAGERKKKSILSTIDIMLLHPYSIDRSGIELKTFFLRFVPLCYFPQPMQRKLDINHCKYDTLQFPMNYWLLIYAVEEEEL